MRLFPVSDEELRSIRIGPVVSHGKNSARVVLMTKEGNVSNSPLYIQKPATFFEPALYLDVFKV